MKFIMYQRTELTTLCSIVDVDVGVRILLGWSVGTVEMNTKANFKKSKKKELFLLKIVFEFSKLYRRLTSKKLLSKIKNHKRSSEVKIGCLKTEFGAVGFYTFLDMAEHDQLLFCWSLSGAWSCCHAPELTIFEIVVREPSRKLLFLVRLI